MQVADREVQTQTCYRDVVNIAGDLETLFEKASYVNKVKQGLVECVQT